MIISPTLHKAELIRRYKRFLADVRLTDGSVQVVHCPNPGSMIGCAEPGSTVYLRHCPDPHRKLPYTWVITSTGDGFISVDTLLANKILRHALENKSIPALGRITSFSPEVSAYGSRFDFGFFNRAGDLTGLMEVKSTTLANGNLAMFPDARTERGSKHLRGLIEAKKDGLRAIQFYLIARDDVSSFAPADHIDPAYGAVLREAARAGVEVFAFTTRIEVTGETWTAVLNRQVPAEL